MLSLKELLKESLLEADEQAIDNALDKAAKQYKVSPEELRKAYELVNQGALDEGAKDVLKKMLTPLMVAALMSLPTNVLSQDKKDDLPDSKKSVELAKFGNPSDTATQLTTKTVKDWEAFTKWLDKTPVKAVDGSGDTSKLKGNAKLDRTDFNNKMLAAYKKHLIANKLDPNSNVFDPDEIGKIQMSAVNHRNGVIMADKVNEKQPTQGVELASGKYRGTDYSGFLKPVKAVGDKIDKDGKPDKIIGQNTSQLEIPRDQTTTSKLKQVVRAGEKVAYAPTPVRKQI